MENEIDNGLALKIETIRKGIIELQNPDIPIKNIEILDDILREALNMDSPIINMASIVCPNWGIGEDGKRTVLPMDDSSPRIEQFFGVDLKKLLKLFDEHGISTNTLIIVSDIVENSWVKVSNEMFEQNRQFVAGIVKRNAISGTRVPQPTKVMLQKAALGQLTEADHKIMFAESYKKVLCPSTSEGEAMFRFWQNLDRVGAYSERRMDATGLKSIRDRVTFLSALYLADGAVMNAMVRKHLREHNNGPLLLINAEMELPFAMGLMELWSIGMQSQGFCVPIITPSKNGTDWSGPLIT